MTIKPNSQMKIWIAALAIFMVVVSACTPATKAPATPTKEPAPTATEEAAPAVAFDVDAILANAGGDCQEPTGDPLRIGYVGDFSELGGFADIPGTKAAEFISELINCAGGVDGTPLDYRIFPADATDLDLTTRAGQDAVDAGVFVTSRSLLGPANWSLSSVLTVPARQRPWSQSSGYCAPPGDGLCLRALTSPVLNRTNCCGRVLPWYLSVGGCSPI